VTTAVPAGGSFRLYVPTADTLGNTLYADDLGTGVADGDYLPCEPEPGETVLLASLDRVKCRLFHGNNHYIAPAMIEIS